VLLLLQWVLLWVLLLWVLLVLLQQHRLVELTLSTKPGRTPAAHVLPCTT
jgi:hypothetical protein